MKNIKLKPFLYKLILCTTVSATFWQCSRDLDFVNPNELTEATFWQDENDAYKGVVGTYDRLRADTWGLRTQMSIRLNRSDEVIGDREEELDYSNFVKWDGGAIWNVNYQGIFRANQVIANVPKIKMDEAKKKRIISEAKFLRAYWYFDLLIHFENIVLVTEIPTENAQYFKGQSPSAKVWEQIITDLNESIPNLPEKVSDNELGRATSIAANALLGKVYLFQKNYTAAEGAFAKAINSVNKPLKVLQPNFEDNFGGNEAKPDPEFLFMVRHSSNTSNGEEFSVRPYYFAPFAVSGWRLSLANPWLLSEMKKEKTVDNKYDPRLLTTLHWNDPASIAYGKPFSKTSDDSNQVYLKKWFRFKFTSEGDVFGSSSDFPLIRYADVLLMQAEVKNELGKGSEAVALINQVRERANLKDFTSVDKSKIFEEIMHQRLMELAGEGHRYQDLKRWNMLAVIKQHDPHPATNNLTLPRDLLLQIPQSEIDANPNIKQNPGF